MGALPRISLLISSVSVELVYSSARVTSLKHSFLTNKLSIHSYLSYQSTTLLTASSTTGRPSYERNNKVSLLVHSMDTLLVQLVRANHITISETRHQSPQSPLLDQIWIWRWSGCPPLES